MKEKKLLTILVVILLAAAGMFVAISFREPEVKRVVLSQVRRSGTNIVFELDVEVYNPNLVGGILESLDLKVYIDDRYVGPLVSTSPSSIPGRGSGVVTLEYTLAGIPILQRTMTIRVSGDASVSVGFFTFDVDVDRSQTVSI